MPVQIREISFDRGSGDDPGVRLIEVELHNDDLSVRLLNVGAALLDLRPANSLEPGLVLGLPGPEHYLDNPNYLGVTVGPVANRIGGARFEIGGRMFRVEANEGANQLHGGSRGFGSRLWDVDIDPPTTSVRFSLQRPDGEGGYPGNLDVEVDYVLDGPRLVNRWTARTDAPTPVSLANHAYWNLGRTGADPATLADQSLQVRASRVVEVDSELIPTGAFSDVVDTPLDLRSSRPLPQIIDALDGAGLDHCFLLDSWGRDDPEASVLAGEEPSIVLSHPSSGTTLAITTTLPGVQVYTGQHLDGSPACGGHPRHGGVCLETQQLPDAVNNAHFPGCLVVPGRPTTHTTVYRIDHPRG